jgi:hypothetical protein
MILLIVIYKFCGRVPVPYEINFNGESKNKLEFHS